jgi:hypothetical protein
MDIAIELLKQEADHLRGYDPQDWRGKRLAAVEAELAQLRNTGTELSPLEQAVAEEVAAVRRQVLALARNPGFSGISKTIGRESLDSVVEDVVRAVARKLIPADTGSRYARFLSIARGA